MNRFLIITFYFFIFLFLSCQNKNIDRFHEKDFSQIIELKGDVLTLDEPIMRPTNIYLIENLLVLQNRGTDYIYEIYDLETNKKINECLSFGNGPEEMIRPTIVNLTNDDLWIYDIHKLSLFNYKLKDFITTLNPKIVKKITFDYTYFKATVLSDNNIVASPSKLPNKKFDFFNSEANLLDSQGEYSNTGLTETENRLFYRFDYVTSADDKIFLTYHKGDIIEIYNANGDLIRRKIGPNNHKPVFKLIEKPGFSTAVSKNGATYQCYHGTPVRVEDEVFVLYFGDLYEKYNELCSMILVFDFDGNPLRIYNLDIPLIFFTVDVGKKIIYGITDQPDDFHIIKYEY
jgi:hypothetical protein